MALATTTLSSACAAGDNSIVVASATSLAAGRLVLIDQEMMQVAQSWVSGTTVPVLRGRDGSVTADHKVTANVTHGLASDFAPPPGQFATTYPVARPVIIQSLTTSAAFSTPYGNADYRVMLNGTSVIALTLTSPTKDMDGCRVMIVGNGAAAHTITYTTTGFSGAGGNYDLITTNATAPIAYEFVACNGLWVLLVAVPMAGTVTNVTGTIS